MSQQTFSDIEYGKRKRKTKRDEFLEIMNKIIPWDEWVVFIVPYYYKGKRGRSPKGIEKMLRMYLLQMWFNLSDEGIEDAIYDSYAMRKFMGINFCEEQVPDATTLLKFRHIMEKNNLGQVLFNAIRDGLEKKGRIMHGGTIVDATIIEAPSLTKNTKKTRDPEMHQTKKGNQWHFGMIMHVGVDAGSGYVHTIEATRANEHDITVASKLIREDDEVVYSDSAYIGVEKRPEILDDEQKAAIDYSINQRPGKFATTMQVPGIDWNRHVEYKKSAVRCKVEHPFRMSRHLWYSKIDIIYII